MSENTVCPECGSPRKSVNVAGEQLWECGSGMDFLSKGWIFSQSQSCKTIASLKSDNEAKDLEIKGLKEMAKRSSRGLSQAERKGMS